MSISPTHAVVLGLCLDHGSLATPCGCESSTITGKRRTVVTVRQCSQVGDVTFPSKICRQLTTSLTPRPAARAASPRGPPYRVRQDRGLALVIDLASRIGIDDRCVVELVRDDDVVFRAAVSGTGLRWLPAAHVVSDAAQPTRCEGSLELRWILKVPQIKADGSVPSPNSSRRPAAPRDDFGGSLTDRRQLVGRQWMTTSPRPSIRTRAALRGRR